MRILRNKIFSDENSIVENKNNKASVRVGEALGTAGIGTLASIEGSKLIKGVAKKPIENFESKVAKKKFKSGLSDLTREKLMKDISAKDARINGQRNVDKSLIDIIFHKKNVKKLDEDYAKRLNDNNNFYKNGIKDLKKKVISDKNARIAKKLSRLGKGTMVAGLAATGLVAGSKLIGKRNNKNKE